MGLPRNPSLYRDVAAILDAARVNGGGTYECSSHSAAVRWRARAYMLRAILLRQSELQTQQYGLKPSTPYDGMFLRMLTSKSTAADMPHTLSITFEDAAPGILKGVGGNVIELEVVGAPRDELEMQALAFAKGLGDD